jgi:hypothetical protein
MKKIILIFFLAFLLSSISRAQYIYETKVESNLRDSTSTNSKIITKIPKGGIVNALLDYDNGWWLVKYKQYEGYVFSKNLIRHYLSGDEPECYNINKEYDTSIDNYLKINVGENTDVAVKLMKYNSQVETCIRTAYIRAGEFFDLKNIPQGQYYLKIAYGKNFRKYIIDDQCIMRFENNALYEKGTDILDFDKKKLPNKFINGDEYENWDIPSFELKLDVVITNSKKGKSFKSSNISEIEFNK